jgi:uncharacterized membrane protein YphA (DoxX/SURF4 family)
VSSAAVTVPAIGAGPAGDGITGRRRALTYLGHAARIALGAVFLAAGALKIVDVAEFARQIAGYGLIGPRLAAVAAPVLIAVEIALAAALLAGCRTRAAAILTGLLLVLFIALEGWGIMQGRTESCGCFGAYVQRTPQEVILEDLLFTALAVMVVAFLGPWEARRRRLAATAVAAATVATLGLAIASPRLPIDPWVTGLAVGRSVEDLGLAARLPAEVQASGLVAILDLADPASKDAAAALNDLAATPGLPRVLALTPSTEEEHAAFLWQAYPAFEVLTADRPLLKRLYRRLPLYFLIRSGRVEAIYPGPRPPAADLLSSGPS